MESRDIITGIVVVVLTFILLNIVVNGDVIPDPGKPKYTFDMTLHRPLFGSVEISSFRIVKGGGLVTVLGIPGTDVDYTVEGIWTGPYGSTSYDQATVTGLSRAESKAVKIHLKAEDGPGWYNYEIKVINAETGHLECTKTGRYQVMI